MALVDINFQEGEWQDFVVEISLGTLEPAEDIVTSDSNSHLVNEIDSATTESNIFIMSE